MPSARTFRLSELAEQLGGEALGDADVEVTGLATLENAGPQHLTFFTQRRYRPLLERTRAGAVIVGREDRDATGRPRIVCEDPYLAYALAARLMYPAPPVEPGVHPSACIERGAVIDETAQVGPHCHVGADAHIGARVVLGAGCAVGRGVRIGEDSRLYPNVTVYDECIIGRRAIIHSGAVIGADGFGMARDRGRWTKIPQTGRVVIGDDVEIGANTAIDRGALDDTVIEDGVKLDNLIQIGHNVRIGAHSALAGCVGVAGSARIGRRCTIGGGAAILGHLEIGDDVHVSACTVVTRSLRGPGEYAGIFPAQEKSRWTRNAVLVRNLEELARRVRLLEDRPGATPGTGRGDAGEQE